MKAYLDLLKEDYGLYKLGRNHGIVQRLEKLTLRNRAESSSLIDAYHVRVKERRVIESITIANSNRPCKSMVDHRWKVFNNREVWDAMYMIYGDCVKNNISETPMTLLEVNGMVIDPNEILDIALDYILKHNTRAEVLKELRPSDKILYRGKMDIVNGFVLMPENEPLSEIKRRFYTFEYFINKKDYWQFKSASMVLAEYIMMNDMSADMPPWIILGRLMDLLSDKIAVHGIEGQSYVSTKDKKDNKRCIIM